MSTSKIWTLERRVKQSLMARDRREHNTEPCPDENCNRVFYKGSQELHEHMLFEHGVYMPTCTTKKQKAIERNCIIGWSVRDEVRAVKAQIKKNQYKRRMLWRGRISSFFENAT